MNQVKIKKESAPKELFNGNNYISNNKINDKPIVETLSNIQEINPNTGVEISQTDIISNSKIDNEKLKNNLYKPQEIDNQYMDDKNSEPILKKQKEYDNDFNSQNQIIDKKDSEITQQKEIKSPTARKNDGKDTDSEDSIGESKTKKDPFQDRLKINGNYLPINTPPSNLSQEFFASLFNENSSIECKKEIIMK